ncbi:MAG: hypothetical protein KGJ59_00315 [Bacteroidota bacterium]|nr:hypothetical protein [Bacteroidota bacterium]
MKIILSFFLLSVLAFSPDLSGQSLVNFQHLNSLTERIEFYGDSVDIIHVYSNYPDYRWVDAKESGPEGIACVDDAARAAVVYLRDYELNHSVSSLEKAKGLLKFVLKMQTDDGEFYNFIFADHRINRDGKTSYQSFGWWAARSVWCLSKGYRDFISIDPVFAEKLKVAVERSLPHVEKLLDKYGDVRVVGRLRVPQWLMYTSGSDVTSELLLGLLEYDQAAKSVEVKNEIVRLCNALVIMQDGDAETFPYGAHRSWETMWHMWGNGQTEALAAIGKAFHDSTMILPAEREGRSFYVRLLINGFMKEMDIAHPEKRVLYDQIAYGVRPMAVGLLRVFDATQDSLYLTLAGLAASWLFGNNVARTAMYNPNNGICFDGITDSVTVNKNSGAESTIEALHTLVEIEHYPDAKKYLYYRKAKQGETPKYLYATFVDESGEELTLAIALKTGKVLLREGGIKAISSEQ